MVTKRLFGFVCFLLVLSCLATAGTAHAIDYNIEGQLLGGLAIFPEPEDGPFPGFFEYGVAPSGYPLGYTGRLSIADDMQSWSFSFTAEDSGEVASETIFGSAVNSGRRRDDQALFVTEETITIDWSTFVNQQVGVEETLTLTFDRSTQSGEWRWRHFCIPCDTFLPFPSASGTIGDPVPEPNAAVLLAVITLSAAGWPRRF